MDEALPGPVRLKLDQALDQFQHWQDAPTSRPELEEQLTGGRSNTSLCVGDGSRRWVIRIDGIDPVKLGLSRDAEWRALHNAHDAALAPRPVYRNPAIGVLVYEYCAVDTGTPDSLAALAHLLRSIHALPPIKYRLDPLQRARGYLTLLGERELPAALTEACEQLDNAPLVLCHNDLLCPNRLARDGRLLALDWEYVAMGDPLFDIAVIVEGDGLTDDEAKALHGAWLGDDPSEEAQRQLALQRTVYRELAALWERAMPTLQAS